MTADTLLMRRPEYLAVLKNGEVACLCSDEAPFVAVFDSTGHPVAQWGRRGEGPGELDPDGMLFSLDTAFVYAMPQRRQAIVFRPSGEVLVDRPNAAGYEPVAAGAGALVVNDGFVDHARSRLTEIDLWSSGRPSILVPASDTVLRRFGVLASRSGRWPMAAFDGRRLVIGDGYSYSLAMYRTGSGTVVTFGRELAPRMRTPLELKGVEPRLRRQSEPHDGPDGRVVPGLDLGNLERRARRDTLPHFVPGGLGFDDHGRLWVVGQANDSTFADVFTDTTFLGRQMLDCRDSNVMQTVAIADHWIAMVCESADENHPYTIRLFRIEER